MMNICSDAHDEICFEGRNCPCCQLKVEIEKLEDKVGDLSDEIKEHECPEVAS